MPLRRKSGTPALRQRGFSLVELSIAILIALFLLGGLVTLLMGTRRTNATQSSLAQLQDNERIAMTLITNVVQNAGYMPNPVVGGQTLNSFLTETYGGVSFSGSQVVGGIYNASAPGDTFAIRFFAPAQDINSTIINCAGQSNASAATLLWYTNVFSVANVNGTFWLQCQARGNNNGAPGTPQTVNLIPNVTNISVLYGLGSATGASVSDYSVVQYLNAAQVTALTNGWLYVTCVKVTLTFLLPQYGTVGGQMMSSAATNSTITFQRVIPIMSRVGVNVI